MHDGGYALHVWLLLLLLLLGCSAYGADGDSPDITAYITYMQYGAEPFDPHNIHVLYDAKRSNLQTGCVHRRRRPRRPFRAAAPLGPHRLPVLHGQQASGRQRQRR